MNIVMRRAPWLLYVCIFVVVLCAALQLRPVMDDWFFLNYFTDSQERWSANGYRWLFDSRLLMRDFWRPLEDLILTAETHAPSLFPALNHMLAVGFAFGAGVFTYLTGCTLGIDRRRMGLTVCIGMLMANNMGTLLSIDSITQAMAVMFGMMSVWAFITRRMGWWFVACVLACLSKETGVVFTICGPLLRALMTKYEGNLRYVKMIRATAIGGWLAVAFLAVYCLQKVLYISNIEQLGVEDLAWAVDGVPFGAVTRRIPMTAWSESYVLTPIIFVKNVFILFVSGIWPVDTSAIAYREIPAAVATGLFGLGGVIICVRLWIKSDKEARTLALKLIIVMLISSLPSLITRAGEISAFASNQFLVLALSALVSRYEFNRFDNFLIACSLIATLSTDAHKYKLAYEAGERGHSMAQEVLARTPDGAKRILWIGEDTGGLDPGGAIFTKSPFKSFYCGSAAIHELGYDTDVRIDRMLIAPDYYSQELVNRLAGEYGGQYDCVWLEQNDNPHLQTVSAVRSVGMQ